MGATAAEADLASAPRTRTAGTDMPKVTRRCYHEIGQKATGFLSPVWRIYVAEGRPEPIILVQLAENDTRFFMSADSARCAEYRIVAIGRHPRWPVVVSPRLSPTVSKDSLELFSMGDYT